MPSPVTRAQIIVSGVVQGVGYRYYTLRHAQRRQLVGRVKNLYNGDVEIVVEGEQGLIADLIGELRVGPRAAAVSDVAVAWLAAMNEFTEFTIE